MPGKLDAPIPGQSLTTEPGNAPWEQPPQYADVQEALAFHMKNLNDDEKMDDAIFLLDQGFPLNVLVESITSYGVMNGVHTIDASILINPVIHEYLKTMAEAQGVNVKEDSGPSADKKAKAKEKQRLLIMLQKQLPQGELAEEIGPSLGMQDVPTDTMSVEQDATTMAVGENTSASPTDSLVKRRA